MLIAGTPAASANPAIEKDTIEVRSLCLLSCKGETERLARYLCASEQKRAARFHFQVEWDRYVTSRAVLRLQLGALLDCDPKSLSFQYASCGKPFIENCG